MIRVEHLSTFLTQKGRIENPAVQGFTNYISHFSEPGDPLEDSHWNRYFEWALSFERWQQHPKEFDDKMKRVFDQFTLAMPNHNFDDWKLEWPSQRQIIRIEHSTETERVIERFMSSQTSSPFRVIAGQNGQLVVVIRNTDNTVEVRSFDSVMTIGDGLLRPLNTQMSVHYTPQLSLEEDRVHCFPAGPHKFIVLHGSQSGSILRGLTLQRQRQLENRPIEQDRHFLFPLKKLEAHFIKRSSDPLYVQIIEELERISRLLRLADQTAAQKAQSVLETAQVLFDHVYPDDRMLKLLIGELDRLHGANELLPDASWESHKDTARKATRYDLTN